MHVLITFVSLIQINSAFKQYFLIIFQVHCNLGRRFIFSLNNPQSVLSKELPYQDTFKKWGMVSKAI